MRHIRIAVKEKEYDAYQETLCTQDLILIKAEHGYVMCGYLNREAAEKFGDIAVVATGVSDVEGMLEKQAVWVSSQAKNRGVEEGMLVKDLLEKL